MGNSYSWSDAREGGTYRLPGPEHLGWWAAAALVVSLLMHVALFFALDHLKIALRFTEAREMATAPVNVEKVEVAMPVQAVTPEEVVVPPTDAASLLEEVDLLAKLPEDADLDIRPDVLAPEYALKMTAPASEGEPEAPMPEVSAAALEVESDLPELGRSEASLQPAAIGQVTVDPGAVPVRDGELDRFTDDLIKKGAQGKVKEGALEGVASLDDLIGLPPNVLVSKKTLLPSDLLFEFNSDELRESAKVGLMKLGLLIDRNPKLYCWVEGHTDLIGSDEANLDLSRRRAASVRNYLVDSLRMDGTRILTRGKGELEPLVPGGSIDEQAPNRRVEIRMRKEPPPPEAAVAPRALPVAEGVAPRVPARPGCRYSAARC